MLLRGSPIFFLARGTENTGISNPYKFMGELSLRIAVIPGHRLKSALLLLLLVRIVDDGDRK